MPSKAERSSYKPAASAAAAAAAAPGQHASSLHLAAAVGDADEVRRLIDSGADLHARDADGRTPLQAALRKHDEGRGEDVAAAAAVLRVLLLHAPHPAPVCSGAHSNLIVLRCGDGAEILVPRTAMTQGSSVVRAAVEAETGALTKDSAGKWPRQAALPVAAQLLRAPLPQVAGQEAARIALLLGQLLTIDEQRRCVVAALDLADAAAMFKAAWVLRVAPLLEACAAAIAELVRNAARGDCSNALKPVTPPCLEPELCNMWLQQFVCGARAGAGALLSLLCAREGHRERLLLPLAQWDDAWCDGGKGWLAEEHLDPRHECHWSLLQARCERCAAAESDGSGGAATSCAVSLSSSIGDAELERVAGFGRITSLRLLWNHHVTSSGLAPLKALPHLTTLELGGFVKIDNAGLAEIKELTQLTSLGVWGSSNITDEGVAHLTALVSLTSLNLQSCRNITDAGVACLKTLRRLTSLNLEFCSKVTNVGLTHVAALAQLKLLNVSWCAKVSNAGIVHLTSLQHLESLAASHTKITNAGLKHFSNMKQLTALELESCRDIQDAGLPLLGKLCRLTALDVARCGPFSSAALLPLLALEQLTALDITGAVVTDEILAGMARSMPRLKSLSVTAVEVTNRGLAHLAMLSNLESLKMEPCIRISDDGIAHLAQLSHLASLVINGSNMSDRGLRSLASLTRLKSLSLRWNLDITDAGVAGLLQKLKLTNLDLLDCNVSDECLASVSQRLQ